MKYHSADLENRFSNVLLICLIFFITLFMMYPSGISICSAQSIQICDNNLDLMELSIEDLMSIEVTSVSKKKEKLSNTTAAIFVITNDDIRRSGVTTIPETLRMVPGLQVARIDSNKWAISSRGFTSRFSNKLLVLIDGRTVYDPVFSGVFWDVQDTMLEDIDRIEVIRGPGATLWGANAVNGVINIITKNSKATQGVVASGGFGTEEQGFGNIRYGGKFGENASFRFYTKYFNRDSFVDASGTTADDDWDMLRGGFRTDWESSEHNSFKFQGDIYGGNIGQKSIIPSLDSPNFKASAIDNFNVSGGNLLGHWQHLFSNTSDFALQLYYDKTDRDEVVGSQKRDTFDIDLQHRFALGNRQEIIWGLGYRLTSDDVCSSDILIFNPDSKNDQLFSGFIQNDITLVKNYARLTLGAKFEHNDYTGFEFQPNARLLLTPNDHHSIWGAISRAVRTPSRYENDVHATLRFEPVSSPLLPYQIPAAFTFSGKSDRKSEDLLALELGYRFKTTDQLSFDMTAFYNFYDNLRSVEVCEISQFSLPLVIPFLIENKMDGESYGFELAADWQILKWWDLQLAYTFFKMDLDPFDEGNAGSDWEDENSPDHQVSIRSGINLPKNLELDLWLRYVDTIPNNNVDSYITLDARLGWKAMENLEISLVGQNLFESQHAEFVDESLFNVSTEVQRSVYGKITWKF